MANLKVDLIQKINDKKYYEEMELVRLAQDPNMNYEVKVYDMLEILGNLAILNAKLGLVNQYFQEPATATQAAPVQNPPSGQVHQGQTHGE